MALRFDDFELDEERAELSRGGTPVALQAQPLRLLTLLARHAGELVTRQDIRRHLWPDQQHLEFDQGINTCIRQVRQALGDPRTELWLVVEPERHQHGRLLDLLEDPPDPIKLQARDQFGNWYELPALLLAQMADRLHRETHSRLIGLVLMQQGQPNIIPSPC